MCWCRPEIRTPNCGRIGCYPPDKSKELEKAITDRDEIISMLEEALEEISKGDYGEISYDPPVKQGQSIFDKQDIAYETLNKLAEWRKDHE